MRHTLSLALTTCATLSLTACLPQSPTLPAPVPPTPTLIGADLLEASPTPHINLAPTIYERPAVCTFPYMFASTEPPQQAAVYRFSWQGNDLTLDTAGGALTVTGLPGSPPGPRAVAILHNGPLPPRVVVDPNYGPDSILVLMGAQGASEVRTADGTALQQTLFDPANDNRFVPEHLDILQVDRVFGPGPAFSIGVRLVAPPPLNATPVWTWESYAVVLGDRRYTARVFADGKTDNGFYTALGGYRTWDGDVGIEPTSVTWAFTEGADLPFSAVTATSAANGDTTETFPMVEMQSFYEAAVKTCGK